MIEAMETIEDYWVRSEQYWRSSVEFWARHAERNRVNDGPVDVTKLKNETVTGKCRCGCGESVDQPDTGRKRLYASDSCRVRYNRNKVARDGN